MLDDRDAVLVERAVRESARDALGYSRKALREYRRYVGRTVVRGTDSAPMEAAQGAHASSACGALSIMCQELGVDFSRLVRILERHADRMAEQFRTLQVVDADRVSAARVAEQKAAWAKLMPTL